MKRRVGPRRPRRAAATTAGWPRIIFSSSVAALEAAAVAEQRQARGVRLAQGVCCCARARRRRRRIGDGIMRRADGVRIANERQALIVP